MNASKLLVIVIVLQGLILMGQWTVLDRCRRHSEIPDAGGQRMQMIEELRSLGAKVDRIATILESGKVQVRLPAPDEKDR